MPRDKTLESPMKTLMVRLPAPLLEAFKAEATKSRRSLNGQLLYMMEAWLDESTNTDRAVILSTPD
jgi:hypothetical protein